MRTSRVLSITMPEPMLEEMQVLAKKENRTMSELVREALRQYQRDKYWDRVNAYGQASAARAGVNNEDDVIRVTREFRRSQRSKRKAGSAA